jgi:hypothetical protein
MTKIFEGVGEGGGELIERRLKHQLDYDYWDRIDFSRN